MDLCIRDEKEMDMFLKQLIYKLYTLNGKRDSARPLLDGMQKLEERKHM